MIVFWAAAAAIGFTYVLFPGIVLVRGWLWSRPVQAGPVTPPVSLIVAAHNEAGCIAAKLDNILALDYPRDRLEVLIASDGSTDGTDAVVAGYANRGIRLLALPRGGKAAALNAAVAASRGAVLVFSDATSVFTAGALRALVEPFADPAVGGVAGDQRYSKSPQSDGSSSGECAYWGLERILKRAQSMAGSVTSATGAIYAIRRTHFVPVPDGVTDDFVTSARVVAQGARLVFAPQAAACEPVARSQSIEFGRKVRIMTRGLRGVWLMRELLNPCRHGFYALQLFAHKVLRRLVAVPLLLLLLASPALVQDGVFYRAALAGQVALYGCGLLGMAAPRSAISRVFALPVYFVLVNVAALGAMLRVLTGRQIARWEPRRA